MRSTARHEHWAAQEWIDTIQVQRKQAVEQRKAEPPLTLGDALIAVAIVAVLAWIFSKGPWL